jgi:ribosomal protein S9
VVIEFAATPPIIVGGLDLQRPTAGVASAQLAVSAKRRSPIVAATVVAETAAEAWTHAAAIVAGGATAIEQAARAGISRAVMVAHDGAVLLYPAVGEPSDTPFLRAD